MLNREFSDSCKGPTTITNKPLLSYSKAHSFAHLLACLLMWKKVHMLPIIITADQKIKFKFHSTSVKLLQLQKIKTFKFNNMEKLLCQNCKSGKFKKMNWYVLWERWILIKYFCSKSHYFQHYSTILQNNLDYDMFCPMICHMISLVPWIQMVYFVGLQIQKINHL